MGGRARGPWRRSGRGHRIDGCSGAGFGPGRQPGIVRGAGGFGTSARRPDVRVVDIATAALGCAAVFVAGCAEQPASAGDRSAGGSARQGERPRPGSRPARMPPKRAQAALINAKPGDVIELGAGRFDFRATLSLDVSGVTVRGQGPDKTILSFKDQGRGPAARGCSSPARRTSPSRTSPSKTPAATRSRPTAPSGSSSATSAPSGPAARRRPTAATGSIPCSAPTW